MRRTDPPGTTGRTLEWVLAAAAPLACLGASMRVWQVASDHPPAWPLPGAYGLEALAVTAAGALGILRGDSAGRPRGATLTWAAIGVLSPIVVLGAWSIGALHLPAAGLLLLAALLHVRSRGLSWARHLGIGALGALGQAALMLVVIALAR